MRESGKTLRLGMDDALSIRVSNGLKVEMYRAYQMYQIKRFQNLNEKMYVTQDVCVPFLSDLWFAKT